MASENALQKQKAADQGIANAPAKKKIGFFSAMMVVVGSSVGAGIFFKAGSVLTNSQSSLIFAIFCWLLAAFAVVSMGLALIEIASARNDNLSMIGWCQTFNGRWVYKACKNFMVYIYLPLTFFFMPLYVVLSIQDGVNALTGSVNIAGDGSADWVILMAIAVGMTLYFVIVCGLSSKIGNIQNWIITSVKFLPLIFAVVAGFVAFGMQGGAIQSGASIGFKPSDTTSPQDLYSFAKMTPGFGLFIAVSAIFFAYDGFYVAAGLQTEMKEPKKTPIAILLGLVIVTVIYLLIAIAMMLGSTSGDPFGFQDWLKSHNLNWLYATFQILIGVGVLGIINGFAMWSTRFMEDLIKANEVPFSAKFVNKINDKVPYVGIVYNLVISLPIVIVFCIIGGLGYVPGVYGGAYADSAAKLYSFADLMGTWTALLAFAFIMFAVMGALKNRKTNAVKVEKSKFFKPFAILTILTMILPLFMTFIEPFANVFFLFRIPTSFTHPNVTGSSYDYNGYINTILIPRIMVVIVFFIFMGLMIIPELIEQAILKSKYGSVDRGLVEKARLMANAKNLSLREEIVNSLAAEKRTQLETWEKMALKADKLTDEEIALIREEEYTGPKTEKLVPCTCDKDLSNSYVNGEMHIHSGLSSSEIVQPSRDWKL